MVISHDYWQSHFGGDAAVIGREIRVNEQTVTIVGVSSGQVVATGSVTYRIVVSA